MKESKWSATNVRAAKTLRVLITGAARGIGMATAQVLANRGHSVVATDVSAWSGLEGIQAHVLDVTSDDSVARCLKEAGPRCNRQQRRHIWRRAGGRLSTGSLPTD